MTRTYLSLIVLSLLFFVPLTATGETPFTPDCEGAQEKMEQARHIRTPFDRKREETQEQVRHMYQELFICHSTNIVTKKQERHCLQLEEDAPKQFQTMIQLVTASHQASLQLKRLTLHVKQICPTPATTPLTHISQLAIR